jgi:FkbM family methyltransferase
MLRTFRAVLPERVKSILRWILCRTSRRDNSSNISIKTIHGFCVAFRKDSADEAVLRDSFDHDRFFSEVPEYQPCDDHIIVDIGAHIGTFALLAASKVPSGKVYAVEPCEDTFTLLRINIALNKATNVSAHHLAISDKVGSCWLNYSAGNWGHSVVARESRRGETVESCDLGSFLERNGIDKVHFMKLNCEGSEFPILLNCPSGVLQRFETILVLYHCDMWSENTEQDLLSLFESNQFSCVVRNKSAKRGWIVARRT